MYFFIKHWLKKRLLQQGLSEPEFYVDMYYKLRRDVGKFDFSEIKIFLIDIKGHDIISML